MAIYGYDSFGLRVSETVNGATTVFPTPEFSTSGATTTISFSAAGMPIATIEKTLTDAPRLYTLHTDHLQSVRLVTSEGAAQGIVSVVESTDYDAFGKITNHTQSTDFAERKKFTSHEFDSSTGYTYAKARYLNTDIGRFIAQDRAFIYAGDAERFESIAGVPLVAYLLDPQLQNSYSYARNNPVKFVDPTGEFIFLAPLLIYGVPALAAATGFIATYPVLAGAIGNYATQQPGQAAARLGPYTGEVIDASEAITGRDAFSGEELSVGERILSGGSALLVGVSAGMMRSAKSGIRSAKDAAKIAETIAGGHALEKHLNEFADLGISTKDDLAKHIESIITNPTQTKALKNSREAYMHGPTNTIVIYDPTDFPPLT